MISLETKPSVFQAYEPIGFWNLDLATNLISLDDSTRAFFSTDDQTASDHPRRESLWTKIHPDDLASLRSRVQEAVETKGPLAHICRLQLTPQSMLTVRVLGHCLSDDTGKATHVTGILMETGGDGQIPHQVQVVEHLMEASKLAGEGGNFLLEKLIDAVLLEAGRNLARSLAGENTR